MALALCKCGVDMVDHGINDEEYPTGYPTYREQGHDHPFSASGTKYRCEEMVETDEGYYLCPRPRYHEEEGVPCGPLTGEKLWD